MKEIIKKYKAPQKGSGCNFMVFIFAILVIAGYKILYPFITGIF